MTSVEAVPWRASKPMSTSERARHRASNGMKRSVRSMPCPSQAPIAWRRGSVVSGSFPRRVATTCGKSWRQSSHRTRAYVITISTTSAALVRRRMGIKLDVLEPGGDGAVSHAFSMCAMTASATLDASSPEGCVPRTPAGSGEAVDDGELVTMRSGVRT